MLIMLSYAKHPNVSELRMPRYLLRHVLEVLNRYTQINLSAHGEGSADVASHTPTIWETLC